VKNVRAKLPAAMTLACRIGSTQASTIISMRHELVAEAAFSEQSKFDVLVGTGTDSGKLRLVDTSDGIVPIRSLKRTNAWFVDLGVIAAIGTERRKRQPTDARVISAGTVEIDIPNFSADDGEEQGAPAPVAPKKPAAGNSSASMETLNGISIDFARNNESVTFKGNTVEVTTRQAKLTRLLARPRPAPVDESFLIAKLWDNRPPTNAHAQLRTMCSDLQKGFSPIGLNLNLVKGAGYQLKDL
jgi:DNA-binding winged helix-turn-helix (wHTH) protein